MNIILLSGGSGKRLWPLSNEIRSKQFIKIFKTENGYESMLQKIYGQIKRVDSDAVVTIAAGKSQVSSIYGQLGNDVGVSVEPCRRDTFPAIALAMAYLCDVQGVSADEAVAVCPVDPDVDEDYFEAVNELWRLAQNGTAKLCLMGIEPTYPSEKYGYIMPVIEEKADNQGRPPGTKEESLSHKDVSGAGEESGVKAVNKISRVLEFKEKPDAAAAERYIEQGGLWNGGVFACKISYVLDRARELTGFASYADLFSNYESLAKISFDYAVVEHEKDIAVLRFDGKWKDLGTWNTLTEAMEENAIGNVIFNETCENVHAINELKVPILAMGLKDTVISASPEGILVSDKEQSSYIKPFVDGITQQVMFAEKSWGSYRVLDVEEDGMTVKVTLNPGHKMNYHSHEKRDEVWTVMSGYGRTIIDGMEQPVKAGDVVAMPAGVRHTVIAGEQGIRLIEVQIGREISVADKHKYEMPDCGTKTYRE